MITKIIAEAEIQKAKKYIGYVDKIVIVTHLSPDGDAIGSSLGLYHFLLEEGKLVNIMVPNDFPEYLKWMKGARDIINYEKNPDLVAEIISDAELIFCLDFNALKRIQEIGPLVEKSTAKKVLIDHHLEPEAFCNVTMSYPQIASTAEMIFRFICRMGFFEVINRECAECIYTGMMTDTGAFTYNSNNPEIYYIIGELLRKGIDKDDIYRKVYHNYSLDALRLRGYVYEKLKVYPEYGAALIALSKQELNPFQCRKGDTEGLVNLPLTLAGVSFSVFIKEDKEYVKVSIRSTGSIPCNEFASKVFQGGGHLNAAGGEFYGTFEEAVALFERELPEFFETIL